MDMKILKSEKMLCTCCMEEHEVKTVQIKEQATFKDIKVNYEASYMYCDAADELYMDEHQMQDNDIKMKNKEQAYIETAPRDVIQFKYAESLRCIVEI